MAMALLRRALETRGCTGVGVTSAGTAALTDAPASDHAVDVVRDVGIDLSTHRSRPIARAELLDADVIVAMAGDHLRALLRVAPEAEPKVLLLKALAEMSVGEVPRDAPASERVRALLAAARPAARPDLDVADPYGGSRRAYRALISDMEAAVEVLATALCGSPPPTPDRRATAW